MPVTYIPLATQTLGSAAASVTFSSISAAYTDLVLVQNSTGISGAGASYLRLNGDTGANYSRTRLLGNGTTASSYRESGANYIASDAPNSSIATTLWNIMNYSNTTTNKTLLYRDNSTSYVVAQVGMWRNTSAITSISITADAGQFAAGSTFSLYGVASTAVGAKATGGTIFNDGTYYYHAFTASGTFTPSVSLSADILCIAGGGGAGDGGGGAGGLQYAGTQTISTSVSITVGAGGSGGRNNFANATIGSNSVVTGYLTANGGGPGQVPNRAAYSLAGGSGGGSIDQNVAGGTASQGNAGGAGYTDSASYDFGGGGGGFTGAGTNAAALASGSGGNGSNTYSSWGAATFTGQNISGTYWYAGGGAGGGGKAGQSVTIGSAGNGGGGAGAYIAGTPGAGSPGLANSGGGGGGGTPTGTSAGNGGSGLVIVRYAV